MANLTETTTNECRHQFSLIYWGWNKNMMAMQIECDLCGLRYGLTGAPEIIITENEQGRRESQGELYAK